MSRYLTEARHHLDKIRYYYDYAGGNGFSQAEHHYWQLGSLVGRARSSKNDKNDAGHIEMMYQGAKEIMDTMEKRKAESLTNIK